MAIKIDIIVFFTLFACSKITWFIIWSLYLGKYLFWCLLFKHCILSYLIWTLLFPNCNKSACTHAWIYVLPLRLVVTKWATNAITRGISNIVQTLLNVNAVKMKQEIGGIPIAKNGNIRAEFSHSPSLLPNNSSS